MKKLFIFFILGLFFISFASATIKGYDDETETALFYEGNVFRGGLFADVQLLTPKRNLVGFGSNQTVFEFKITSYIWSDDLEDIFDDYDWGYYDLNDDWEVISKGVQLQYKTQVLQNMTNLTRVCEEDEEGNVINCDETIHGYYNKIIDVWNDMDEENVSMLQGQIMHIRGRTYVEKDEYVEWIPKLFGKEIEEWAQWVASMNSGLSVYISMNETSGTLIDYTGNVTLVKNPTIIQNINGYVDKAINMSAYGSVNWTGVINFSDFTVSMWIKPDGTWVSNNRNTLFSNFETSKSGDRDRVIFYNTGNDVNFQIEGSSYTTGVILTDHGGVWWHYTLMRSGTNCSVWINGTYTDYIACASSDFGINDIGGRGWAGLAQEGIKGGVDEVGIWNRTLSQAEINYVANGSTPFSAGTPSLAINLTSPANITYFTTSIDVNWTNSSEYDYSYYSLNGAANQTLTQNDTVTAAEGANNITIYANDSSTGDWASDIEYFTVSTLPGITNVVFTPLNSSQVQDGLVFNSTYLQEIEYMRLNFSAYDPDGELSGDITLYFTANGSNACSLGNRQNNVCYNFTEDNWIVFQNGTTTSTFKDEGNVGDFIDCDFTATNSSWREYSCLIDEHYNPNVFKWYNAEYNFSDIKFQNATDQRITGNKYIRVEFPEDIPLDADSYKLDFRVQTSTLVPTQPLEAYGCNSTYVSGEPEGNANCALIASLLPSAFQDDGTKFRGLFTKDFVDGLGDGKYIILKTDQVSTSRWYAIKTYEILNGSHTQKWEYALDAGSTWQNLGDGYETEMNFNWFYDGANPTEFDFKVGVTDNDSNVVNSSVYNMTWVIDPNQNYPPLIDIIVPVDEATVFGETYINWTISEPNSDSTLTNITLSNGTDFVLQSNLQNTTLAYLWNTSEYLDGNYNLTIESCENDTVDEFCGNDTHSITIFNAGITVTLLNPTDFSIAASNPVNFTSNATASAFLRNASLYTNETGSWAVRNITSLLYLVENNINNDTSTYSNSNDWEKEVTYNAFGDFNFSRISLFAKNTEDSPISIKIEYHYTNGTFINTSQVSTGPTVDWVYVNEDNIENDVLIDSVSVWTLHGVSGVSSIKNISLYALENVTTLGVGILRDISDVTLWNVEYCDINNICNFSISNFTVSPDITSPVINIFTPENSLFSENGETKNLNFSATDDVALDVCILQYAGSNTSINCAVNTTFTFSGLYNSLSIYANDTFGNAALTSYIWNDTITMINQSYETEVVETAGTNFTAYFNHTAGDWSSVIANLNYNGTDYLGTTTGSGNVFSVFRSITVPELNESSTNFTFYWNLSFTNVTSTYFAVASEKNQTASQVTFRLCTPGESPFLNFTTYNALPPIAELNATFQAWWELNDASGGGGLVKNASFADLNENVSNWQFCLFPNSTNFTITMQSLADAITHTQTNYYILDEEFDGSTQSISLYLLNDSFATLTKIQVVDRGYNGIEDVLIFVQRYDIGTDTYYTVDMAKTADDGTDLVYLHWYDSWYRFVLVQNGEAVKVTTAKKISESPEVIELFADFEYSFQKFKDIEYSLVYNNATQNFVLVFVTPTAGVTSACLNVIKRNVTNDYTICNNCETSSSATIYCNIASAGNGTFIATFQAAGSLATIDRIFQFIGIPSQVYELLGNEDATALAILAAGIILSFFLFSPIAAVMGMILGIGAGYALGFQPMDLMSFVGIVVAGGIVIYLMKK